MKRRIPASLACSLGLALLTAASAGRQETRIAPPANQVKRATPINMAAKPDLKVVEVWLADSGRPTASGPGARLTGRAPLGRSIWLACKLTNAGADLKTAFVVTYLVDGKVVGSERIRGLAAGRTALSAVAYEAQSAGPHKLRCEADREGKIAETTRANNALEIPFTVADGRVPLNDVPGLKRGESDRPTVTNPVKPPGSATLGHGTPGAVGDKTPRTPRPWGTGGNVPAYPPNEAPLAWAFIGPSLSPPEVPEALEYKIVVVASNSNVFWLKTSDLSRVRILDCSGGIQDQTTTVIDDDQKAATFVTVADGTFWRADPMTFPDGYVYQKSLRRAICPTDKLTAKPIVHLLAKASANFRAHRSTDLVYVFTNYDTSGCSWDFNRVHALRASDGLPNWTFNETGQYELPGMVSAGSLDIANDRLFIVTKSIQGSTAHTVWAIDVATGARVWSTYAQDIENSPVPLDDRVFVASQPGLVSALDRNTGALIWKLLEVGQPPVPGIATMTAATVPNIGRAIFLVMACGRVLTVKDDGDSGEVLWDISLPGGKKAKSHVSYEPNSNMLYVGADDGQVYQIDASSGAATASRIVDADGTAIIGDPVIWYATGVAKLIACSSKGAIAEFLLPWPTKTFGQ